MTSQNGATAFLVQDADGWHIELELDNGTVLSQNEPPFETMEEAKAALDRFCEENDIERLAIQ